MITLPDRKVAYGFILLLLFLIQSTTFFWLLPGEWIGRISPHFVFIGILFVALFVHRIYALVLGLCFGLLHDVLFYGHMIGVYTFLMGIIAYLTGLALPRKHMTFFYIGLVMVIGLFSFDSLVTLIYMLFKVVDTTYQWALLNHILPSLLMNMLIFTIFYIPIRKFVEKMMPIEQDDDEN